MSDKNKNIKANQDQDEPHDLGPLTLTPQSELDEFAGDYSEADVLDIVKAWRKYASRNRKNMIVADEVL